MIGGCSLCLVIEHQVIVHPYTFRQVCSNGAIMVHAVQTRVIERVPDTDCDFEAAEACDRLAETVRACTDPAVFETGLSQMQVATQSEATIIGLMPMLSKLPASAAAKLLEVFSRHLPHDGDRSRYGLMNAVTATARDTRDPELRWRLEELGGAVAAGVVPAGPVLSYRRTLAAVS